MKINIVGSIFGSSGYDSHTRSLANALYKIADCKLSTQLPQDWMKHVNDAELDMITKTERKEDWNLIISIPHMWQLFTGLGRNMAYVIWEGYECPLSWVEEMLNPKINLILTPSEHTKQAIINTCAKWSIIHSNSDEHLKILEKIRIIPHGHNPKIFYPREKEQNQPFTFFIDKGWARGWKDRGGLSYLIKSYLEEFTLKDNVKLLIKINMSYGTNIQQFMNEIKIENKELPKIEFITQQIPFEKLPEIYKQANVYCMPSLSESFGLGALQAMAMGIPCIANNFGGQIDFINDKNGILLKEGKLKHISDEIIYEGILWKEPNIQELRKQMRWAFENQNTIKEMGKQAEEDSKNWTWDNSAEQIIKAL